MVLGFWKNLQDMDLLVLYLYEGVVTNLRKIPTGFWEVGQIFGAFDWKSFVLHCKNSYSLTKYHCAMMHVGVKYEGVIISPGRQSYANECSSKNSLPSPADLLQYTGLTSSSTSVPDLLFASLVVKPLDFCQFFDNAFGGMFKGGFRKYNNNNNSIIILALMTWS